MLLPVIGVVAFVVDDEFENELTLESNDEVDDDSGKCGKALNEAQ